ncbi:ATP-binding cassette domain-containing protein [Dolosigranulum pigrum]|uniref:ATP-binding cassette domain-containing protein n=1 Tax=Dolosigranulum pigrum TaxID=29394 RepID=UPI003CC7094B
MGELSGGERMRLKWAQLIQGQYDLLLLDEPTNHLDVDSKELIEEVLAGYTGSMVIVSHDQYFTDTCCNKLYELTNGQLNLIDKSVK